jgi:hypothetical protein
MPVREPAAVQAVQEHVVVTVARSRALRIKVIYDSLGDMHTTLKTRAALHGGDSTSTMFTQLAIAQPQTEDMQCLELTYRPNETYSFRYIVAVHPQNKIIGVGKAWLSVLWNYNVDPLAHPPLFTAVKDSSTVEWTLRVRDVVLRTGVRLEHRIPV